MARCAAPLGKGAASKLRVARVGVAPPSCVLEHLEPGACGQCLLPLLRHVRPLPNPKTKSKTQGESASVTMWSSVKSNVKKANIRIVVGMDGHESNGLPKSPTMPHVTRQAVHKNGGATASDTNRPDTNARACHLRKQRSGCGMTARCLPSSEQSPAIPSGDPLGLKGYASVGLLESSTNL